MRDWVDLILRVGEEEGFWPGDREIVSTSGRHRPGSSEVMALRVGHEKLTARDRLAAARVVGGRRPETIRWYAENRDRWIGRVDWLPTGTALPLTRRRRPATPAVQRAENHELACSRRLALQKHDLPFAASSHYDVQQERRDVRPVGARRPLGRIHERIVTDSRPLR